MHRGGSQRLHRQAGGNRRAARGARALARHRAARAREPVVGGEGAIKPASEFDALLETVAGLAAANVVIVETLHEHGVLDKRHFAHAFGRALDGLAPEHRGRMIEAVLRNLRDRCMNLRAGTDPDARAFLERLLAEAAPPHRDAPEP